VRDLQHKVGVLEAQLQETDELKRRVVAGERTATEWKEKWNYQNFKLNLMVDMLVLKSMETETRAAPGSLVSSLSKPTVTASGFGGVLHQVDTVAKKVADNVTAAFQEVGRGVGKMAASHTANDVIEEDVEEM